MSTAALRAPVSSLPGPVAAYFAAANAHDADATAACFTDCAVLRDEGRERRGRAAIRAWKAAVDANHEAVTAVTEVAAVGGQTVVMALVSGRFPGSPIELAFAFTVDRGRIATLAIR